MKPNVSKDLLDRLLEGKRPEPSDVDELIAEAVEDQYVDFKAASDAASMKATIRRWITGFANAEGGILALGVSSERNSDGTVTRRWVTGVPSSVAGRSPLEEWANTVLLPLAGRFSPAPVPRKVEHSGGAVLLIATARAPELIPYDGFKYALRIADATVDVPEYLLVDLVLGRRRHPVLDIRSPLDFRRATRVQDYLSLEIEVLRIENRSLVFAEDTNVGVVSWSLSSALPEEPNKGLLQYLDPIKPTDSFSAPKWFWRIQHFRARGTGNVTTARVAISPFETASMQSKVAMLPVEPRTGILEFAIYILPKGSPPIWYGVSVRYSSPSQSETHWDLSFTTPELRRLISERARLTWRNF